MCLGSARFRLFGEEALATPDELSLLLLLASVEVLLGLGPLSHHDGVGSLHMRSGALSFGC